MELCRKEKVLSVLIYPVRFQFPLICAIELGKRGKVQVFCVPRSHFQCPPVSIFGATRIEIINRVDNEGQGAIGCGNILHRPERLEFWFVNEFAEPEELEAGRNSCSFLWGLKLRVEPLHKFRQRMHAQIRDCPARVILEQFALSFQTRRIGRDNHDKGFCVVFLNTGSEDIFNVLHLFFSKRRRGWKPRLPVPEQFSSPRCYRSARACPSQTSLDS